MRHGCNWVRLRLFDESAETVETTQAIVADYTGEPIGETEVATLDSDSLRSMLSGTDVMLSAEGRGETELRYLGNSRDDHRRNRRVELVVVRQQSACWLEG